jgi:hypothetical protein
VAERSCSRCDGDLRSEDISSGAHTGLYNARGAHWRGEGGGQERELADKYRAAKLPQFTHPFVSSSLLMSMVKTYERKQNNRILKQVSDVVKALKVRISPKFALHGMTILIIFNPLMCKRNILILVIERNDFTSDNSLYVKHKKHQSPRNCGLWCFSVWLFLAAVSNEMHSSHNAMRHRPRLKFRRLASYHESENWILPSTIRHVIFSYCIETDSI